MYEPGKIFNAAGTGSSTGRSDTAEIIDLNAATPVWTPVARMPMGGRRDVTGTILADGQVLVTGGQKEIPYTKITPSYQTELWNPATLNWTVLAPEPAFRAYHSIAILLPDARVLSAGGVAGGAYGDIFSPPYLFKGPRPTITSAPTTTGYNSAFFVGTPDAASVAKVTFIRLASVTHGFNESQRFSRLNFSVTAGGINVIAPSGPTLAPPGHYMLFILNANGVPSVSKIIRLDLPRVMEPPTAPAGLQTTSATKTTITLAWTDTSSNEAGFKIERSTDGLRFTQIALVSANSMIFSNSNLTSGTKYFYRVRAYNAGDNSAYSNVIDATTPTDTPDAPVGLTASGITTSSIDLSWTDGSTNELAFRVERSTDGVGFIEIGTTAADVTSLTSSELTTGTKYYYRVLANNAAGVSDYSNVLEVTTLGTPAAPTGLTTSGVTTTSINLSWTDASSNEAEFKIERSTDGASFSQIGTTAQNTTTFTSSGLTAGTKYYYRVRASNEIADSGYSNVAEATTLSPPTTPTGLMISGVTSTTISLLWTDASSDETGFKIERSTDGAAFSQIGTTAQNTATFTSSGLTPGAKYYYRVRANNVAGDSSYSNVAEATTALTAVLPAPSSVTATPISSNRVDVRWVDNSTDEIGFKIERSLDGITFTQIATVGANGKTYSSLNLTADTHYYYRVRAYNAAEHSAYSPVASATPPSRPLAPTNLTATVDSLRRVLLAWTDNASNEAHVRVYRSTDGVTYTRIAAPTTGPYRDSAPVKGQTNYYRVAAYNVGGESAYSNIVEVIP